MRKLLLFVVLFACLFVFTTGTASATEYSLEEWCELHVDWFWDAGTSTCTVTSFDWLYDTLRVEAGETLTIDDGGYIQNWSGTINNSGVININLGGTLDNSDGTLNNVGTINNLDFFYNHYGGNINNDGTITNNYGATFTNNGTIDNYGTINNNGNIGNLGAIFNYCAGIYIGDPPVGNPIVTFACAYLPYLSTPHSSSARGEK
jgi:hypothetical protein